MDDPIDRALALIARRRDEPITLADLAEAGGLSPFHFSRVFAARLGESPMAHVRRRRLIAAAERLIAGRRAALAEVALDAGFESQTAFTRALRRLFGATPGVFRRAPFDLDPWRAPMPTPTSTLRLEDTGLQRRPAFTVTGVRCAMTETDKSAIPEAWARLHRLEPPAPGETFGVIWAAQEDGVMNYLAGSLRPSGPAPEGMESIDLPAATYWTFRQTLGPGPVPEQVQRAVAEIWGRRVPASPHRFARSPDFELYPADFTPGRDGTTLEYWLPVED